MKKLAALILAVVALVVCIATFHSWTSVREDKDLVGTKVIVTYTVLNIRENPDTNSEIIGVLKEGDTVTLSGRYTEGDGSAPKLPQSFGWYELESGGWIVRKAVH